MKHVKNDPKVALRLFLYFFRIGWFTFGGGFSIIAQMQKDFAEKRKIVDEQTLLDQTAIGRSLPGLMVANVAYLFGYSQGGLLAGIAAVLGITTPPVVMLAVITMFYTQFRENVYVARALTGVRAAVPAIILTAAMKLRKGAFTHGAFSYALCLSALLLTLLTGVNILWIIIAAAVIGIILTEVKRRGAA